MKNQRWILAVVALLCGGLFLGCKKSEDAAVADPVDAGGDAAAAAVAVRGDPTVSAQMQAANDALAQAEYDNAVGNLMQANMNQGAMSEAQKAAYQQQLRDTTMNLLERSKTDPKAMEAYQNMGRMMTGR